MQDWGRDVVRQVAINAEISGHQFLKIDSQDVGGNDLYVGPFAFVVMHFLLQVFGEGRVRFDGNHSAAAGSEQLSHFTVACAYLNPRFVCAGGKNLEDALAPGGVAEEVLSHALSSHAGAKCSNAAQSEANKSSVILDGRLAR